MPEKLASDENLSRTVPDDRASLMAAVNEEIRVLAHHFGDNPEWDWPFVCECGDEGCEEPVLCSIGTYDELKSHHQVVLARGHAVEQARTVRAQSEALRQESAAVRAQSELQLRRKRQIHR
jgi:hypothetical protein